MTVKEGSATYGGHTFKMAKLCPHLSSNYYEYLIHDKYNTSVVRAWDLMMGVNNLADCIASLQKALDKKNGNAPPEVNVNDLPYHMQIDL